MKLRNWQKALDIVITQNLKVRGSKMAEFGLITHWTSTRRVYK